MILFQAISVCVWSLIVNFFAKMNACFFSILQNLVEWM